MQIDVIKKGKGVLRFGGKHLTDFSLKNYRVPVRER